MAKFYGKNSGYLIIGDLKNYGYAVGLVFLVLIIVWAFSKSPWVLGAPIAALVGIFFLVQVMEPIIRHFRRKSNKFYRGFSGELDIKHVLEELPDDFAVFQDLNFTGLRGNIDFAVVGPTGIFTIEVKSHRGAVGYNGSTLTLNGRIFSERNVLKQGFAESMRLKNFVKQTIGQDIYVKPVVVFSRGYGLRFGLKPIDGVYVIAKDFLLELITRHPVYQYPVPQEKLTSAINTLVR